MSLWELGKLNLKNPFTYRKFYEEAFLLMREHNSTLCTELSIAFIFVKFPWTRSTFLVGFITFVIREPKLPVMCYVPEKYCIRNKNKIGSTKINYIMIMMLSYYGIFEWVVLYYGL